MAVRWFRISYAENALRRFSAEHGFEFETLRAADGIGLMLHFYRDRRAQHAVLDEDGDGLLWQWGPDADATRFTIGLTRQLVREGDDQPITQLTLCLAYRWTPARRALGRGHAWCFSPASVDAFERNLRSSAAYRAVVSAVPTEVFVRTDSL